MGSICSIRTNPKLWTAYESGKALKPEYGGESLWVIIYGWFDDYPEGAMDMEILMRESVYKKVLSGEYIVSKESSWKRRLILIDSDGNEVPQIAQGCCY